MKPEGRRPCRYCALFSRIKFAARGFLPTFVWRRAAALSLRRCDNRGEALMNIRGHLSEEHSTNTWKCMDVGPGDLPALSGPGAPSAEATLGHAEAGGHGASTALGCRGSHGTARPAP